MTDGITLPRDGIFAQSAEAVAFTVWLHRGQILNANEEKGKHWGSSADRIQTLRQFGDLKGRTLRRYERLRVTAKVSYPDHIGRDVMNLYPTMKAYVDGMVNGPQQYRMVRSEKTGKLRKKKFTDPAYGILPDDNDRYLVGPWMEWSGKVSGSKDKYLFEVLLEPLPPLEVE
jgi:hypothetical protein